MIMKFSRLLLATAYLRVTTSTTIQSSDLYVDNELELLSSNHRRLTEETTCMLYQKCVTYGPTEEHPEGYDEHSWVCELSSEDSAQFNMKFVSVVESSALAGIKNATSGASTLTMSEAVLDTEEARIFVPDFASVEVRTIPRDNRDRGNRRNLKATTGTLTTLVIRVSDKNDIAPGLSSAELKDDVFDDAVSLKTQIEECSYDKLMIEPFSGNTPSNRYIDNGVVDIKMDYDASSSQGYFLMSDAATIAAEEILGSLDDPMFDLVLFCLPPGEDFVAFAYVNWKASYYNNNYCKSVSVQLHEVGHNLGLAHSGQTGQGEYGDGTGAMGSSMVYEDDTRFCYNPQKNYQLGWYSDQVESTIPIGTQNFVLNGVSDYKKNTDALVVLRLEQTNSEKDYYIGYNRAEGVNEDTLEDRNKVTIVRKESGKPYEYGESTKVAALMPGQHHDIPNFYGESSVRVTYLAGNNGNANIEVSGGDGPLPTPAPGPCKEYTIEFTTDGYPEDNSWYIADMGGIVAAQESSFQLSSNKYSKQVCLPMGDTDPEMYRFTFEDSYGDGVCCSQGIGLYKIIDDEDNEVLSSNYENESFFSKEHYFEVAASGVSQTPSSPPSRKPTKAPTSKCKNSAKKKFRVEQGGKRKKCKWYAKKEFCDKEITAESMYQDSLVWEVCQRACKRC